MNTVNSLELVVQPFPDGSFMLYYWNWEEISPGLFEPKDTRIACESRDKLIATFAKLTAGPGLIKCPGEAARWYAERARQIQKQEETPHI